MEADLVAQKEKIEDFMDMLDGHPQGRPETIKLWGMFGIQLSDVNRMIKNLGDGYER